MKNALTFFLLAFSLSAFAQSLSDTTYIRLTAKLKCNEIPETVFQMKNLKHIYIKGDDCDFKDATDCWMIYKIQPEIKNLENLETLALPQNGIKYFPAEIAQLKKLRVIDLTDNNVADIDVLTALENLEQLYLYGCNLNKLPQDLSKFKKLKKLGLKGNSISKDEIRRAKKELPGCEIIF